MEPNHTRNSHARALQVRHAALHPIGTNADGSELVHAGFGAQVVDLCGRGVELEERVINCSGDRGRERVRRRVGGDVLDGGDGGGDHGGPFWVGVAGCGGHCCCVWWGCLLGSGSLRDGLEGRGRPMYGANV